MGTANGQLVGNEGPSQSRAVGLEVSVKSGGLEKYGGFPNPCHENTVGGYKPASIIGVCVRKNWRQFEFERSEASVRGSNPRAAR